jgi:hypothetical protein
MRGGPIKMQAHPDSVSMNYHHWEGGKASMTQARKDNYLRKIKYS